jgi:hypothetical protein
MPSVTVQTPFNEYTANGATTVFPYEFQVLEASHLVVSVDDELIPDSDYTLSGVGDQAGGDVTFDDAPAADAVVVIERQVPLSRSIEYTTNGPFPAATVNKDFNLIWMALQALSAGQQGSIRLPYPEDADELPAVASRLDRLLAFDPTTGAPEMSSFTMTQVQSAIAAAYLGGAASTLDALAFIQAGTGAVSRTAQNKMRDLVALTDFGAVGDGVTDDTAALRAALTYVMNNSRCLFIPDGAYRITEQITIVGTTNFSVRGEGQELSQLIFEGGAVGLDLYAPARTDVLGGTTAFYGFSILKDSDNSTWAGTALKFTTGTVSGGNPSLTLSIDSVTVGGKKGNSTTNKRFKNGIHLVNCWQAQLSNLYLTGAIPLNTSETCFGIKWEDSTGSRAMNIHCYRFQTAFLVTGTSEGPSLVNCVAVGVQDGIHVDAPDTSETNPGLDVKSCHLNVSRYGIWADNRAQGIISGCLFYERNDVDETIYKCIYMTGTSRQWVINGNVMTAKTGTTPTTKIAIHLDGRGDNIVFGNQIRESTFTRGIHVGADVYNTAVFDNLMDTTSTLQYINNSTDPNSIRYRGGYAGGTPTTIFLTATNLIPHNTATFVSFTTVGSTGAAGATLDDDGAVTDARIVVPDYAKRVRITTNLQWAANTTGIRTLNLRRNNTTEPGAPFVRANASSSGGNAVNVSTAPIDVVPGDYFTISVTQTSGGDLDITAGNNSWIALEVLA